jgi:hypothetical protein
LPDGIYLALSLAHSFWLHLPVVNACVDLDPRGQPSGLFGRSGAAGADMLANRNPDTQPLISHDELALLRMAPRLESLDNKTIYLVDTGFAGGKEFFEEMQKWFNENMPSVKIVVHPKPGNAFADSPEF